MTNSPTCRLLILCGLCVCAFSAKAAGRKGHLQIGLNADVTLLKFNYQEKYYLNGSNKGSSFGMQATIGGYYTRNRLKVGLGIGGGLERYTDAQNSLQHARDYEAKAFIVEMTLAFAFQPVTSKTYGMVGLMPSLHMQIGHTMLKQQAALSPYVGAVFKVGAASRVEARFGYDPFVRQLRGGIGVLF